MRNDFSIQTKQLEDAVVNIETTIKEYKDLILVEQANLRKFKAALTTIMSLNKSSIVEDDTDESMSLIVSDETTTPQVEDDIF